MTSSTFPGTSKDEANTLQGPFTSNVTSAESPSIRFIGMSLIFNKISITLRGISNFKINIQKEIIFYQELNPNLSEETALNDLNNNFHIQVNKNKDNYIKAVDFRGKEMYLFKEDEKIKLILIDFKNKPKSAYFSIAKCIEF